MNPQSQISEVSPYQRYAYVHTGKFSRTAERIIKGPSIDISNSDSFLPLRLTKNRE